MRCLHSRYDELLSLDKIEGTLRHQKTPCTGCDSLEHHYHKSTCKAHPDYKKTFNPGLLPDARA